MSSGSLLPMSCLALVAQSRTSVESMRSMVMAVV